jgi:hypothetical protein
LFGVFPDSCLHIIALSIQAQVCHQKTISTSKNAKKFLFKAIYAKEVCLSTDSAVLLKENAFELSRNGKSVFASDFKPFQKKL